MKPSFFLKTRFLSLHSPLPFPTGDRFIANWRQSWNNLKFTNALAPRLEAITDLNRLKALNLNASLVTSFEAFEAKL